MPYGGNGAAAPTTRRWPTCSATSRSAWAGTTPGTSRRRRTSSGPSLGWGRKVNRFCTVLENGKRWRGKHSLPRDENPIRNNGADVAELVDARDLKSLDGNVVWVRVPPPAPVVDSNGFASTPSPLASPARRSWCRCRVPNPDTVGALVEYAPPHPKTPTGSAPFFVWLF
jgi:hypothetical protein